MSGENKQTKGSKVTESQETGKALDDFTVFQDVSKTDLDNKSYEVDEAARLDEEAIAANPMMAIGGQELQDPPITEGQEPEAIDMQAEEQQGESGEDNSSENRGPLPDALEKENTEGQIYAANEDSTPAELSVRAASLEGADVDDLSAMPLADIAADDVQQTTTIQQQADAVEVEQTQESEEPVSDENPDETPDNPSPNPGPDPEPEPELLTPNVKVRVSHATDNQKTINSEDGYDFPVYEYGVPYTVTGEDLDIAGVKNSAQITYMFADENSVEATLDSPWNSVKNIEVFSDTNANVTLNNFVHTDVALGEGGASEVIINGAKRGNITTANDDDVVEVNAQTNNAGWSNDFKIDTNAGDDSITASGDKGLTGFEINAGEGNDNVVLGQAYDRAEVDLGAGDDTVQTGSGETIITGGGGQDTIIISADDGPVTITDFGGVGGGGSGEAALMPEHDTIKLEGEGLTAENMLLDYDGQNTVITFEGVEGVQITLADFDFTDLDNLPAVQGWNIIFDGQSEGTDAYDVFNDHSAGRDGIWNKDTVTFANNADNEIKGKNGSDDVINAMDGDDVVIGLSGDDVLRGGDGNDKLYGDNPDDTGSSYVTTTVDITYVSTSAGHKNAIGAYAIDEDGQIIGVNIGIENQKTAGAGDQFSIEVNGPEGADVGYFILSNGYNRNKNFFDQYDSADGTYSFLFKAGTAQERAANINDDPSEVSLAFNTDGETIILKGQAYHSDPALNTDGRDHVTSTENEDGTTRLGFEDLHNLGDADFNDVVIDVSVSNEPGFEAPLRAGGDDRLVGGEGDDRLIGGGGDDVLDGGNHNGGTSFIRLDDLLTQEGQVSVAYGGDDVRLTAMGVGENGQVLRFRNGSDEAMEVTFKRAGGDFNETVEIEANTEFFIETPYDSGTFIAKITGGRAFPKAANPKDFSYGQQIEVEAEGGDTAVFSGNFEEYSISQNDDGSYTIADSVAGRDGNDTAYDIEFFEFNDGVQSATSESWLAAVEVEAGDINAEVSALNVENESWLAEVEVEAGEDDKAAEHSNHDADHDGAIDVAIDIADIMPDAADQAGDTSGGLV